MRPKSHERAPTRHLSIPFFKRPGDPNVKKALTRALVEGQVHRSPLILAELIQGARSDREAALLKANLLALPATPSSTDVWLRTGELGRKLRRKGQTVPLTDLAIAASAELGSLELWHADRHYEQIAQVADLRLRAFYP